MDVASTAPFPNDPRGISQSMRGAEEFFQNYALSQSVILIALKLQWYGRGLIMAGRVHFAVALGPISPRFPFFSFFLFC